MAHSHSITERPGQLTGVIALSAAVGAVTAMLFTPRSGQQMREGVKHRAASMKDKMQGRKEDMADIVDTAKDAAKNTVNDAKDSARRNARNTKNEADNIRRNGEP